MFINSGKASILQVNSTVSQLHHYFIKKECLKHLLREQLNLMTDKSEATQASLV